MSVDLVDEQYSINLVGGVEEHRLVRTFQTTGYSTVISASNAPGVPYIGHQLSTEGVIVNLIRKTPRRAGIKNDRKQIFIECEYTNATQAHDRDENGKPVTNLENAVPYLQVQWNEATIKTYRGKFLGIVSDDGATVPISEYPPYLVDQINKTRTLTNSANMIADGQDKKFYFKQITYWTYHRTWLDSWEAYLGDVSSESFTVTQRDQDGVRLQYNFSAFSMILKDIIKEDHWRGSKLWFRRGLVMSQDLPGHVTDVPDVGLDQAVYWNAWNNATWSPVLSGDPRLAKFPNPQAVTAYIQEPILDANGAPIVTPVPLNGQGVPIPGKRWNGVSHSDTTKTYHLEYRCYDVSGWPSALGIT